MTLSDHFDRTTDAGFRRNRFASQANRQFQMSLGLVVMLGIAAGCIALTLWLQDGAAGTVVGQLLAAR